MQEAWYRNPGGSARMEWPGSGGWDRDGEIAWRGLAVGVERGLRGGIGHKPCRAPFEFDDIALHDIKATSISLNLERDRTNSSSANIRVAAFAVGRRLLVDRLLPARSGCRRQAALGRSVGHPSNRPASRARADR